MPQPLILHLYMSQKLMKHSEINDIQNNQTENSCQEVCRLQEINASQDQLMISHSPASVMCADLLLERAAGQRSASWACGIRPPGALKYLLCLTRKPKLSYNQKI